MDRILEAIAERVNDLGLAPGDAQSLSLIPIVRERDLVPGGHTAKSLGVVDPSDREGYAIPYFDTDGEFLNHVNIRFLTHGDGAPKYLTPRRSKPRLYIPRCAAAPTWSDPDAYPAHILVVTEGEFKAFKATSMGLPAVAVPGVDCVSGKTQASKLVAGFEQLPIQDLHILLCFDSDIVDKPEVRAALQRASLVLTRAGARSVSSVQLPHTDGDKTGLDDFLRTHSIQEFLGLPRGKDPVQRALADMNDRYVYVDEGQGRVVNRDNPEVSRTLGALRVACPETVTIGQKEVPLVKLWMESKTKDVVQGFRYLPGAEPIIDYLSGARLMNLWKGLGCEPAYAIDADAFALWHRLLDHLFEDDLEERRWFEQWLAYPVQHPGAKLFTCALLWSTHAGVGKGLLAHSVAGVYGRENCTFLREACLNEGFNDWINSQFVAVEELSGASRNARGATIRDLVTSEHVLVNQKYRTTYKAMSYANFYFNSNHANPIEVRDNERRVFAYKIKSPPIDVALAQRIGAAFIHGDRPHANSLHRMLLEVDMDGFNPHGAAPVTQALREMQGATARPFTAWLRDAAEDWPTFCIENHIPQSRHLFLAEEVAALYAGATGERCQRSHIYLSECTFVGVAAAKQNSCGRLSLRDGRRKKVYALHDAARWEAADTEEAVEAYHKGLELSHGAEI
jgi:hypothetical protein